MAKTAGPPGSPTRTCRRGSCFSVGLRVNVWGFGVWLQPLTVSKMMKVTLMMPTRKKCPKPPYQGGNLKNAS